MITLGIDPGLTGAAAAICSQRGLLDFADLPACGNGMKTGSMQTWTDVPALVAIFAGWSRRFDFAANGVHVVIERPVAMPRLPSQTIAAQFDTFGAIRAVVQCHTWGRSLQLVTPQAWKKAFGLHQEKADSRACAARLYPSAKPGLARVKDHNRAEAILIAHFGLDAPEVQPKASATRRPQFELAA